MENFNSYKNKKIYLAPNSPMTLALEQHLLAINIRPLGFIDKHQQGSNIKSIEDVKDLYDYIFILSPNHFDAICLDLLPFVSYKKVVKISIGNGEYRLDRDFRYPREKAFSYNPQQLHVHRDKIVLISKSFISSNNKAFYLHCLRNGYNTVILTDNKEQIEELKAHGLPYEVLDTNQADYEIAAAKFIVFDQGNYTYLPPLHPSQRIIQLWHGVGLKKMARMKHITYDYFISTSKWTNETNFQHIFSAKRFLTSGYPRNDIFTKEADPLDFLLCDLYVHSKISTNSHEKVILYAPTHRENNAQIPLDFEVLNLFLSRNNFLLIVKLHPFILAYYSSIEQGNYSHIIFHNAHGDVYPLLKYIDVLISDFSSIAYDFLLLNRPILYFMYDKEAYIKNVPLLYDLKANSPGLMIYSEQSLMHALLLQDSYQEERTRVKHLFFEKNNQSASQNILDTIWRDAKGI